MSSSDASPWSVVITPRAQLDRELLLVMAKLYESRPPIEPDRWYNGKTFSMSDNGFEEHPRPTPLMPCGSIVMYQQSELNARLPGIQHRQVYIGRGLCVSVNSNDTVSVCSIHDNVSPKQRYYVWTSPAAGLPNQWRGVLHRCIATLGRLPWQPHGSNCHTVTQFQLTGVVPHPSTTAIYKAWKAGSALGCIMLLTLWVLAWCAAALHRRTVRQRK